MTLIEKLQNVVGRKTFLEFVRVLIEDWDKDETEILRKKKLNMYSPILDDSEWQNGTSGTYLESALSWAEDKEKGHFLNSLPENPTWKAFAEFLYAGKMYE